MHDCKNIPVEYIWKRNVQVINFFLLLGQPNRLVRRARTGLREIPGSILDNFVISRAPVPFFLGQLFSTCLTDKV